MRIDMLTPFEDEYAVARVASNKERKFGLINRQGVFVVHPIYDMIEYIGGDYVCVNRGYKEGRKYRNRWGVINNKAQIVLPFKSFDFIGTPNCKGWLYAKLAGKYGYIDKTGKQIIKIIYDELSPIFNELHDDWLAARIKEEFFYIDQNGKRVLF